MLGRRRPSSVRPTESKSSSIETLPATILLPSERTLLSVDAPPTSKRQAYKRDS